MAHNLRPRKSRESLSQSAQLSAPALDTPSRPSSRSSAHSCHSHAGHSHAEGGEEAAALLNALKGSADRGSRITLIGLACNVGLTAIKGAAGWWLGSAALVADAGHSLSDLVGDFVVLFCWNVSRRPASPAFPYGYGKFESLGTLIVAVLLVLGAVGIGLHSYHSLAGVESHTHGSGHDVVDPNAAWFALMSILVKEWLYRATLRIAQEEKSNVLTASAYHHRSDAYSSIVALAAIGSSWIGFTQADPLGGLAVAGMILLQGAQVGLASVNELLDRAADPQLAEDVRNSLATEKDASVHLVRTYKSGALHLVDLVLIVAPSRTVKDTTALERELSKRIRADFPTISEVAIRFRSHP